MRFLVSWVLIGLMGLIKASWAWNAQGHQLCAQIALDHLPASTLQRMKLYDQAFREGYQPKSLVQSSAWLDWFKCQATWCHEIKQYHYIDYPYARGGVYGPAPLSVNAVRAVQHAVGVLNQSSSSLHDKGFALRVLMHVLADLHQPMHAVTLYDAQFPHGDRGGNDYRLIKNTVARQLHAYWDRGGGLLGYEGRRKKIHRRTLVKRIQRQFPCDVTQVNLDPLTWARESYHEATHFAYSIPLDSKPTHQYQHQVQIMTQQRLALAACRLRAMLIQYI